MALSGSTRGVLIVLAASGLLLMSAYGLQLIDGLVACELCMAQRYAHGVVIAAALLALISPGSLKRLLFSLAVLALIVGAGIALYHVGVEQAWWKGPSACSVSMGGGVQSLDDLMKSIDEAPVIRCGDVQWVLFGLSMAAWNGLLSLGTALLALAAAKR